LQQRSIAMTKTNKHSDPLILQRIPRSFHELDVPVIAAVNGPAHGAGCDLALMCDIRIAAESALFAESFAKVGIIPGDGGAWLLPRAIGLSRPNEMIFTGRAIDAKRAEQWGLVSRVVPDTELMDTAFTLARRSQAMRPISCACRSASRAKVSAWACRVCWKCRRHFKVSRIARRIIAKRSPPPLNAAHRFKRQIDRACAGNVPASMTE
jgi:enoyl-CoA hydratase/carnithine racemase